MKIYLFVAPIILFNSFCGNYPAHRNSGPSDNNQQNVNQSKGNTPYGDPVKRFANENLRFKYPHGWKLSEEKKSSGVVQVLTHDEMKVDISVFIKDRVESKSSEELENARREVISRYIENMKRYVEEDGGSVEGQSEVSTEVGPDTAKGIRLRVFMLGEPGNIDAYVFIRNGRIVGLGFAGPDSELKKAASAWGTIRESLEVL